jgi:hypothetical protein
MNRRKALKMFGGSVAGIGGIYHIGEVRGTDLVEVPTVRGGSNNEIIRTEKVPREWFEHTKRSHSILEERRSEFLSHNGVISVSLGKSNDTYGGMKGNKIVLTVGSDTGVDGNISQEVDGIEVDIKEVSNMQSYNQPNLKQSSPNYNDGEYGAFGGGVTITGTDDEYFGTTCVAINNGNYILTAAHVISDDYGTFSCVDLSDENFHQPWNNPVGKVVETFENRDVALCDSSLSDRVFNFTTSLETDSHTAAGYHTKTSLDILKSDEDKVTNMGVVSGETEAKIIETSLLRDGDDSEPCVDFRGSGVVFENNSAVQGDSGGPWFTSSSDSVYIIGVHSGNGAYTDGDGVAHGLYDIANLGYKIGLGNEKNS